MFFALPTRTAATEIHSRVTNALARAFPSADDGLVTVLAVPGYVAADDKTAQRLPGFRVLWNDDPTERYRYRGWAAENPKRYLAAAVAVGTIDQALFAALRVGHAHLRSTALLRHLLVVDEVHASDVYMTRLLEEVLHRHVAAGGHALLMSATLGASAKYRLLKACGDSSPLPSLDEARRLTYPSILVKTPGTNAVYIEIASPSGAAPAASKSVRTELLPSIGDPEAIAQRALEMARGGAKVLVIRNTVSGCLAVQQALEQLAEASGEKSLLFRCKGIAAPHHSRYARDDRKALDLAIEASFGKHRPEGGLVAVATQTVQQSLDLDADVMLSDLCPMDVLLQRVGRLFRHDRSGRRPAGFESPRLLVLVPETRDLSDLIRKGGKVSQVQGLGSVYDDLRVIEATWRLLEKHETLEIPQMNRELVEGATHPHALDEIAAPGDTRWHDHEALVVGSSSAKHGQAALNLFDWETPFDETEFPSGDTSRRIASRLGADDRRVVFESPPTGPFGAPVKELSIPSYWIGETNDDLQPTVLSCECDGFDFEIQGSSSRFRYNRHGLARGG
jgi:CRISPR-associated endonuclease/helicase Cas3